MEFCVGGSLAIDPVHGPVEAQGFLHSGFYLVRIVAQFVPFLRMVREMVEQIAQQVGGGLVAGDQ